MSRPEAEKIQEELAEELLKQAKPIIGGPKEDLPNLKKNLPSTLEYIKVGFDTSYLDEIGIQFAFMVLVPEKTGELEALGRGDALSSDVQESRPVQFAVLKENISLIRMHVPLTMGMGGRFFVQAMLLHLLSTTIQADDGANALHTEIFSDFQMPRGSASNIVEPSFVDFLIIRCAEIAADSVLRMPQLFFMSGMSTFRPCFIYMTKEKIRKEIIFQAAISVNQFCKKQGVQHFRGCITNGEDWVFFAHNADPTDPEKATFSTLPHMDVDSEQSLARVLGLLADWVGVFREFNYP
ncbi:hypothetical protein CVT26_007636 [Gymnopilus dilepis]|uniref:Uncharacterized protein n=1 Tax=Gymnopilus dilepis TaxID=231916 RepID=A0A409VZN1_9AGAR|nr:hypothetical protein CVT26_007636 [Gymnopilus dilepis]